MTRRTDLTDTELEVLRDVARRFSNIQIGRRQFRSTETARTHTKNVLAKPRVRNRACWRHRLQHRHLPLPAPAPAADTADIGPDLSTIVPTRRRPDGHRPLSRMSARARRTAMTDPGVRPRCGPTPMTRRCSSSSIPLISAPTPRSSSANF
ncbi:LuxR C-terminal-related transcriptional regulator [Amycolatopsis sp. NBRC 101858]|uniref:response regulator transcription factor n=1 Tax=Amycolatopsis sp. NBRC 101858 TaxID=3032200 RepID=UPI00333A1624